ncbi:MAG: ISAzo13 family transposase, partial [Actinomycetota bacterium]|nr:ISAzo13 family transposase [Actinomycetota bacterium]
MLPHLDERQRRLMVGSVAVMLGHGGRTKVAKLSGVSRPTVSKGA